MARLNFDSVFTVHDDGAVEPRQRIRVGGVTLGPGVRFTRGVSIGGIDFTQFIDRELEVETDKDTGIIIITGIY